MAESTSRCLLYNLFFTFRLCKQSEATIFSEDWRHIESIFIFSEEVELHTKRLSAEDLSLRTTYSPHRTDSAVEKKRKTPMQNKK